MSLCVERKSLPCVVALARLAACTKDRAVEALNLLTQADRTLKGDHERFTLRLEQLKVLAVIRPGRPSADARNRRVVPLTTRDRDTLKDHARLAAKKQAETQTCGGLGPRCCAPRHARADRRLAALALSAFTKSPSEEAQRDFHFRRGRRPRKRTACASNSPPKPCWPADALHGPGTPARSSRASPPA
jgi:hypothetical protein